MAANKKLDSEENEERGVLNGGDNEVERKDADERGRVFGRPDLVV